jgi:hypothetical protein
VSWLELVLLRRKLEEVSGMQFSQAMTTNYEDYSYEKAKRVINNLESKLQ